MGQRLRRRFELPFCNDTDRILNVFEMVLLTLKPERYVCSSVSLQPGHVIFMRLSELAADNGVLSVVSTQNHRNDPQ